VRRIENPKNPWERARHEWLGPPPPARLEVFSDDSRSILSRNEAPDLPFRWSLNPYRGCVHSCAYCYARSSHEYLGFGAGSDFDRRIVVKEDAPMLLRRVLEARAWRGELINFSGVTDCYQGLEGSYRLTRACLELCRDFRNPVSIITKSALIERDLELLAELHQRAFASVLVSLCFIDEGDSAALEPGAPPPQRRLETIARLRDAGVPVGLLLAPVIAGLNDRQIPGILKAARAAGATFAGYAPLRLVGSVREVFEGRLRRALPSRAERILEAFARAESAGGRADPRALCHAALFEVWHRKLGYERAPAPPTPSPFRDPKRPRQLGLFDEA
jgi:DNA repair photolyase